ncbi:unnamed protein product [Closterium sp. NIES-64]|nr:unnamed protein product [Closterium sp. NIES-64]
MWLFKPPLRPRAPPLRPLAPPVGPSRRQSTPRAALAAPRAARRLRAPPLRPLAPPVGPPCAALTAPCAACRPLALPSRPPPYGPSRGPLRPLAPLLRPPPPLRPLRGPPLPPPAAAAAVPAAAAATAVPTAAAAAVSAAATAAAVPAATAAAAVPEAAAAVAASYSGPPSPPPAAVTTAVPVAAATTSTAVMATPSVVAFDAEGRAIDFDVWVDDLQLYLQYDRADGLSLFDLTSGASPAPGADADTTVCSQWATRDAAARLGVRRHLPTAERAHFSQYKSARTLYDAVITRYSSPATAALSRLILPFLFPDLAAYPTVADLITHLRTSDIRYRAALPAEFCAKNPPPYVHHPLLHSHPAP